MCPPRAILPVCPGPQAPPASSMTMTSGPAVTVGPPRCSPPALCSAMPVKPVSVEPTASVRNTLGSARATASLTAGENSAAVVFRLISEDVS